jgi:tetratricopeptide (TPR) repeat protein
MRHKPFFERLATADPETPWEWESLSAGLVTLRLIDRRLDRPVAEPTSLEVAAVRASVRRLPDGPVRRTLRAILDTIPKRQPVAEKLLSYGSVLEDAGEFYVASDVYALAMEAARTEGADALHILPRCLDRIGFVARQRGMIDEALRAYEIGRVIAAEIGDPGGALKIDIAAAHAFMWKGEYAVAREILELTAERARRKCLPEPLALALHDLATLAQNDEDYDGALKLYGEALALQRDRTRLLRLLGDLGVCAWHVGLYDTARDAFQFAFANGLAFDAKWTAAINLMELYGVREQWAEFDRWVAVIEPIALPPRLSASFHLHAAEAEQRRGNHARAGALLLIAIEIAERHELREIRELAKRTEGGKPIRATPVPARTILPDDLAAVALRVRAITTSRER